MQESFNRLYNTKLTPALFSEEHEIKTEPIPYPWFPSETKRFILDKDGMVAGFQFKRNSMAHLRTDVSALLTRVHPKSYRDLSSKETRELRDRVSLCRYLDTKKHSAPWHQGIVESKLDWQNTPSPRPLRFPFWMDRELNYKDVENRIKKFLDSEPEPFTEMNIERREPGDR